LLQVQDAHLSAVADGFQDLSDPDQPALVAALGVIQVTASSIAGRAAELERLSGGSHPPDPGVPPNPCQVSGRFAQTAAALADMSGR
jgi:hypothetical protein